MHYLRRLKPILNKAPAQASSYWCLKKKCFVFALLALCAKNAKNLNFCAYHCKLRWPEVEVGGNKGFEPWFVTTKAVKTFNVSKKCKFMITPSRQLIYQRRRMYFQIRKTRKKQESSDFLKIFGYFQHVHHLQSLLKPQSISAVSMVIFCIFRAPRMHTACDLTIWKHIFVLL